MTAHFWIWKNVHDTHQILVKRAENETRKQEMFERLLQTELAEKMKEDRKEKFKNPAILLELKNDNIIID